MRELHLDGRHIGTQSPRLALIGLPSVLSKVARYRQSRVQASTILGAERLEKLSGKTRVFTATGVLKPGQISSVPRPARAAVSATALALVLALPSA